MPYFLDRAVYGSNSLVVDTSKPLGKGAQAVVYPCRIDGKSFAAKIFHSATHGLNVKKINAMIDNPPDVMETVIDGIRYPKYSWPIALIRNQANTYIGYLMPLVDLKDSFTLDHYYDINLIKRLNSSNEAALSFKVEIAKNLAELVADLHSHKHFFIDFKPQNIRVFKGTHAVTLIDCDGFSINGKDNTQYPAELMSTDYIAPEVFKNKLPAQHLGEAQDLYALATIIFQLLNGGIHPFQGILKTSLNAPTNDEKAALALYPHGISANPGILPRPQSVHATFLTETRQLFDKAFVGVNTLRPTANMWFMHLNQILDSGEIVRCSKYPSDVKHMRFKGMECPECHRQAVVSIAPQVPKSKIDYARLKAPAQTNSSTSPGFSGPSYKSQPTPPRSVLMGFEKAILIIFGVIIFLVILVQCGTTKNSSNQATSSSAAATNNNTSEKLWNEIKRGEIYTTDVTANASKNLSNLSIDSSLDVLPNWYAASLEKNNRWLKTTSKKFYIKLENDTDSEIHAVILSAYKSCSNPVDKVYIYMPLTPILGKSSRVAYGTQMPISNWFDMDSIYCVDVEYAYGVKKQTPQQPQKKVGWVSIFYSDITNKYSWSVGASSAEKAKISAKESCEKYQYSCREWVTKQVKCLAIYSSNTAGKMYPGFGGTEYEAMTNAQNLCESKTGTSCSPDGSIGIENSSKCDSWSE